MRSFLLPLLVLSLIPVAGHAAPRKPTTPLADENLFIAPSGQPYRSKAGEPYPVVAWFTAADTNHDGKLDRAEFKAEAVAFFHKMDLRKDGIIDDEIVALYEKKLVPEILAGVDNPELTLSTDKNAKRGAAPYALINVAEPLRAADHNFRGRITLQDMEAQADLNFDYLDEDKRGFLTLEDLPHTQAQDSATVAKKK